MGEYSHNFGFAGLRWSQTAGYGYAPNPRMPKTFMATILDTPNPTGGVHSAFKQAAGARLARAGLAVAYGMKMDTSAGPWVESITRGAGSVVIKIKGLGTGGVQLH